MSCILCNDTDFQVVSQKEELTIAAKHWGQELWLVNNDEYCGKLLYIKKGKYCSFHMHNLKLESFILASGKIILRYGYSEKLEEAEVKTLKAGDIFHIPRGLKHQFEGIEDSIIIEISTTHYENDSVRFSPSSPPN